MEYSTEFRRPLYKRRTDISGSEQPRDWCASMESDSFPGSLRREDQLFLEGLSARGGGGRCLRIGANDMMRWKDGKSSTYPNLAARINAILEDPEEEWATRSRIQDGQGPLCHFSDGPVMVVSAYATVSHPYAGALNVTGPETCGWAEVEGSAYRGDGWLYSSRSFNPLLSRSVHLSGRSVC